MKINITLLLSLLTYSTASLAVNHAEGVISQSNDFFETIDGNDYFDDFYGSAEMVEIATGIKTNLYKAPAVATVISAEQIKNLGATDIDDVLETVPGLHVSYNSKLKMHTHFFLNHRLD